MVVYIDLADNPRGVTIVAVLWCMIALSGTFMALRLYSKLKRTRRLWWDDHFIIISWILLVASASSTTANARLGFGLHVGEVPLENFITFGIQSQVSGSTSVIAVACSKTSFAITLLRLTDGWMKCFIIALLVLLNVTHYISAIFFWVSCNPPEKIWDQKVLGECWPTSVTVNYSFFVGACSTFCDFALALLPWRLLLRYNMYNREKIGVAVAMSMGIFAGITCIVKMTTFPLLYDADFSYNSLPLVLWGFFEPTFTIVAASIPMMRHLFKAFRNGSDRDLRRRGAGGDATITNDNTTTNISGHYSVGGGRENRLAAARANMNYQLNNNNNNDNNRASRTDRSSHHNRSQHDHDRASQVMEERPPKSKDGNRSDSSILAQQLSAGGGSTGSLGMSETGGGGSGEKMGVVRTTTTDGSLKGRGAEGYAVERFEGAKEK